MSATEVALKLNITPSAVSKTIIRGLSILRQTGIEETLIKFQGRPLILQRQGSSVAILKAVQEEPHLKQEDVDELERAIVEGKLPVQREGMFNGK